MKLANRAKMSMTTTGTGVMTLGSPVAGYQSFAAAGVNDQDVLPYAIEDGSAWEIGYGLYTASGTTWTRQTIIGSSNGGAAISCSSAALIFVTPLAANLTETPVRQTVQTGPASSGAPSFLPASSSSLSLTSQSLTAYAPLVVTAAQGFNAGGALDYVQAITSNLTWSGLTANTTNYLYVNAVTGAAGSTTLQPIYQFGGAISTASGQFTFDYQAMTGWLGNGSAAVQTPLVFTGECVTGASTVTSTTAYSYNGYCDTGWTQNLPGTGTLTSKNTNIGVSPNNVTLTFQCTTADQGYSVGDNIQGLSSGGGSYNSATAMGSTRLTGFFTSGSSEAFMPPDKTTGNNNGGNVLTQNAWKWKLTASRGF